MKYKNNYFLFIKLIYMTVLIVYFVSIMHRDIAKIGIELFLLSCILCVIIILEITKYKAKALLLIQVVLLAILSIHFNKVFMMAFPIVALDIVTGMKLPSILYFASYIGLLFIDNNHFMYFFISNFTMIIYYQNYYFIEKYKKYISDYEIEEYILKESIDNKNILLKKEIEKKGIYFENKMLEEKSKIYQSLHDKLGHSINGSLYQLEACKVLIDKDKNKSIEIIQGVIDALRISMDEIRAILRKDKPEKKRMALIQLMGLCDECKKKYGIVAELNVEGENVNVPEEIWEVILDNSFEAVSNALKYSKCTKININISILNKVVRCLIRDNGTGCEEVKDGMGIQGMKSRVRKVNGIINIESNYGFTINMILPYEIGGQING